MIWSLRLPWIENLRAARHGRRDGYKGIPPVDQAEFPQYEQELKQGVENGLHGVRESWANVDTRLKAEFCVAKKEMAAANEALRESEKAVLEPEADLQKLKADAGDAAVDSLSRWRVPLLILLGLIEIPINSIVFRLLGESEVLTAVFAIGLAIILPTAAHYAGTYLKEHALKEGGSYEGILLGLLVPAVIGLVISIAILRAQYVAQLSSLDDSGPVSTRAVLVFYLFANLVIFLIATLASYKAHNPVVERLEQARKRLSRAIRHRDDAKRRLEKAEERVRTARVRREKTYDRHRAIADQLRNEAQRLISIYRTHNLRARREPTLPFAFKSLPEIGEGYFPEVLDWECQAIPDEMPRVELSSLDGLKPVVPAGRKR